jgi:hypothetical protein
MSVQLIAASVWSALTDAARRSKKPAYAAVASFGKGAADLLRLPPGSQLVVDASEGAVKHGQTHPADLKRMRRRKVLVYVRSALTDAARRSKKPAYAGVASFGKGAADLLRLRSAEEWAGRLKTPAEMPVVIRSALQNPLPNGLGVDCTAERSHWTSQQPAISQCG